ncbi:MAG: 2-C-methyl-D-erythritol 4-phosphate cytidylyltransferase [Ignavibacteria bacterium]
MDEIIIATKLEYFLKITALIQKHKLKKVRKITEGGARRQDSVYNALISMECDNDDIILIHDAVRPFIERKKYWRSSAKHKNINVSYPACRSQRL